MRRQVAGIKAGVFALALALGAVDATAALAQDRDTQLDASVAALQDGNPAQALALADAVIASNPRDIDALLLRARALSALGQSRQARQAAQAAYRASDIEAARYASAMIMAELVATDGNYTLSQFWLRRAVQHTSSEAEVTNVARAYQAVRRENPLSFRFSVGAAPNSNINNGSSEQIIMIAGLPFVLSPTAQALSGWSAEAEAAVKYRLFATPRSQTVVGLEAAGRMNWLDRGSRAAAPGTSGHDFDFYQIAATLQQSFLLDARGTRLDLSARAGRNWYGGAKLSDFFGAGAAVNIPVAGGRDALTFTARADRALITATGLQPETVLRAGVTYAHELSWGDRATLSASYAQSFSSGPAQEYRMPMAELNYAFSQPIAGALFSIGASYGYKDYAFSPFTTTGRQDHIVGAKLSADFRGLSYMGFSPVVTVQANRTWSNVSIYTQQSLSGGISLQSRF
ncbi:hypothetical protein [Maritimibacter sp. DP1N21-5]|uniref:hypothetical protein n=1 Tax=Maritimibacter sp. DP1N21-5 TaxID=2836867 RepID=UPI001C46DCE4|nr:hypothetical protein [Maritimibacter sp. DP1N21-5]MBV7410295.1 hypothetical protein [Maritimibacter sp. DP1N21-5]